MNYCYDVLINMNEEKAFEFYEWDSYDPVELIKKIPLFRVNSNIIQDFYLYEIKVTQDFLNSLLDKTILKNDKLNKIIKYACIISDTKNSLVVEFNDNGHIIGRSNLLLDDEANVLEIIYNYKETLIDYEKHNKRKINYNLRQEEMIKKVINIELNTMIEKNDESKLKYLFNEWFGYEENNINIVINKIKKELDSELTLKTKEIYDLIVLSYNKN